MAEPFLKRKVKKSVAVLILSAEVVAVLIAFTIGIYQGMVIKPIKADTTDVPLIDCSVTPNIPVNYYVKTRTRADATKPAVIDRCRPDISKVRLDEFYCKNGQSYWQKYDCPNGCNDGVCIIPAEIHLNVPHNLQEKQAACVYFATYNILNYYKENITLPNFLGASGYYSSFAEMHYGLGWEKYHGKLYMIGGKVLPELGYISYFSQQIQLADYSDKVAPIKAALNSKIPLLLLANNESFWYLDAIRQGGNPTITNFDSLNVFSKSSAGHAVVITGYKQMGSDLFLEISDSGYDNSQNPYYYVNLTSYLNFLNYVKNNHDKRRSFEDPLADDTLIYKIIKDQNKFKLTEPDKSLHTLYKVIDSLYISTSYLEGKVYDEKTIGRGVSVGCDMIELMPKLADTLYSQITIKDSRIDQAESILKGIPQTVGICNSLSGASGPDITTRIANANNKLYNVVKLLSDVVNERGAELKVQKNGTKISLTINPKIGNIYQSQVRISKGLINTNINFSNIKLSSGKYELYEPASTINVTGATYPLTISFDAVSGEKVPLSLSVNIEPDLKGQGIYQDSGYSEILAQMITF
ncbi:MAG: hypothetical protein NT094_01015 [Candidatus Staskawiczbacteria bacterium]|nr:hypothetical protein [Candidatus Staskawiczbacteria bacterium]